MTAMVDIYNTTMSPLSWNGSLFSVCCIMDLNRVKLIARLYAFTSFLSILGAGSIIVYSMWNKVVTSPEVEPLFHLAVDNFLLALTWFVGVCVWLQKPATMSSCFYLDMVGEIFLVTSFFLTANYGVNVYIRLKERTYKIHNLQFSTVSSSQFYSRLFRGLYVASWLAPVVAISPMVSKYLSLQAPQRNDNPFCSRCLLLFDRPKLFLPSEKSTESRIWAMYNSILLIVSLVPSVLLLLIVYFKTERIYRKSISCSGVLTNSQRSSISNMRKRILMFILVFFACWTPALVIACIDLVHTSKSSDYCYKPFIIQSLTAPLQGFLNSIVYGWTRKTFRRAASQRRLLQANASTVQSYASLDEHSFLHHRETERIGEHGFPGR